MRDQLNCPNCGAPRHGRVCEYCGTEFYEKDEWTLHIDLPSIMSLDTASVMLSTSSAIISSAR